ncbi:DUF2726 domain-containing protein [Mariprofundus ferrooxydans]|uniref:DUF2726 domain-containing protein n=1 Tax=Mariprofundus ferrooxydans TaxID=314344 RepID=UPI00142F4F83|nr:DUF2726 domain-containing protein [Mariprofundus ferrooxydans]
MDLLTIGVAIIVIAAVFLMLQGKQAPSGSEPKEVLPYVKKDNFFTDGERVFYHVLRTTVSHQYQIFGQVRLADLLEVKKGTEKSDRQKYFNQIKSKHVDFVLCDLNDLRVVCAIELDDKSHNQAKRIERDAFLNAAFEAAGLPLVRFKAKHAYSESEVVAHLNQFIEITARAEPVVEKAPPVQAEPVAKKVIKAPAYKKLCPNCASNMLRKKVIKGDHAGEFFWCCTNTPSCKTVMPITE